MVSEPKGEGRCWSATCACPRPTRSPVADSGLLPFFAYRFAPRMRDLKDRRLHLLPGMSVDPLLAHWTDMKNPVDVEHPATHWDELLRVATSIRSGTVTASAMLKKL